MAARHAGDAVAKFHGQMTSEIDQHGQVAGWSCPGVVGSIPIFRAVLFRIYPQYEFFSVRMP